MIIKENVTVYQCEHCKKKLFMKHAMIKHEKTCRMNPDNWRICHYCKYIKETKIEYFIETEWHETECKAKAFKCSKLDTYVYPYVVEKKNLPEKFPETFEDQIPMKKECKDYKEGRGGFNGNII